MTVHLNRFRGVARFEGVDFGASVALPLIWTSSEHVAGDPRNVRISRNGSFADHAQLAGVISPEADEHGVALMPWHLRCFRRSNAFGSDQV